MAYDCDLIVIGGSAGDLTATGIGTLAGAKTTLIEKHRIGGNCTWIGCIPSKPLLHAANATHALDISGINVCGLLFLGH